MPELVKVQEGDIVMAPYNPGENIKVYVRGVVLYVHESPNNFERPVLVFMRDAYEAGGIPDATCRFKLEELEFVARGVPVEGLKTKS